MENPETGDMIFFHHEHFSNQNTEVHTDNPSFKIGYVAANLSAGTITDASVTGASLMAAIEGLTPTVKYTTAYAASTGTISANTFAHVVSVRNRLTFNDKVNLTSMKLLDATVAPEECLRQLKLKKGPRPKQRPKGLFGASYVQGTIVVTLFSLCMHMQSR